MHPQVGVREFRERRGAVAEADTAVDVKRRGETIGA